MKFFKVILLNSGLYLQFWYILTINVTITLYVTIVSFKYPSSFLTINVPLKKLYFTIIYFYICEQVLPFLQPRMSLRLSWLWAT